MTYNHTVQVRYGECDMQRVVFNANYWVYCDDAVDNWVRSAIARVQGRPNEKVEITDVGFDFMLKSCSGTWHRGVMFGDVANIECSVSRWGRTSFDIHVDLTVSGDTYFEATLVYVSVGVRSRAPEPVPEVVRRALGG